PSSPCSSTARAPPSWSGWSGARSGSRRPDGSDDNRRLNMTVLFSDIRNFIGLSERMTPDENFAFINAYLARMGPVIRQHGGFIDQYSREAHRALVQHAAEAHGT